MDLSNTSDNKTTKTVGIALSGGFVKSMSSIGVIEVLKENNIPIDLISGCSAGSGIAVAYAVGKLDEVKHWLVNGSRREYFKIIFEPTVPRKGLLKGERLREFYRQYIGEREFSDLNLPTFLVATDLNNLLPVVMSHGKVYEAIQASVGVAGLFVPVEYEGKILTDGGNFHLIPSQPLYENGADYVIAVDSSQEPNVTIKIMSRINKFIKKSVGEKSSGVTMSNVAFSKDPHIINLIARAVRLSTVRIENFHHSAYPYDLLIQPHVSEFKRWSISKVDTIIKQGRKATEKVLPQIKKDLGLE